MGWRLTVKRKNTTETHHRRKKTGKKRGGTGPNDATLTDAPAAPAASTADTTVPLAAPLHTSISTIHNKTYDPKTKRTIVIFKNGVQITADQDEHPQQYRCTFSSQT